MTKDEMQREEVLKGLNRSLSLQYRSIVQHVLAASTVRGAEAGWFTETFSRWATDELDDARAIAAKIDALGGEATAEVAAPEGSWSAQPRDALAAIEATAEALVEALNGVIPPTGTEPRSEAVEHLVEHVLHRTYQKLDLVRRLRG